MIKPAYALLFLIVLFISSCKKKSVDLEVSEYYLITGYTGGYVPANVHAIYFRVSNGSLMTDTSQSYFNPPTKVSQFHFNVTSADTAYNKVKDLISAIPLELLKKNNSSFGTPMIDAGRQDVWARINGISYYWSFQANQNGSSDAVQRFAYRLSHDF